MLSYSVENLVSIVHGEWIVGEGNPEVSHVLLDSRKINRPKVSVFFAISGPRHDGHNYLKDVVDQGVKVVVVDRKCVAGNLDGTHQILVDNPLDALQELARYHRCQFDTKVIGITGSNGKTIVKEWLAQLLASKKEVYKSPRSYNSQVGVALSLLELEEDFDIAVIEAGISTTKEMERLQRMIRPQIGVFTNIGSAHDGGFDSRKEKIHEKLELFKKSKRVVYCIDEQEIHEEIVDALPNAQLITWGRSEEATYFIERFEQRDNHTIITLKHEENEWSFKLPFTSDASIENCLHCITVLLMLHFDYFEIQRLVETLRPVAMRLELKQGIHGCEIIDDSYNNDLAGLEIALDFQRKHHQQLERVVIISDMLTHSRNPERMYQEAATILSDLKISKVIAIGPEIEGYKESFPSGTEFYNGTEEFLEVCNFSKFQEQIILVKGARIFGFEAIVRRLQLKIHRTVFEVNLDALTHNLNFFRSKLKQGTNLMVMVKAFAYGSGNAEVAHLLEYNQVDYLAVAYSDEGVELREKGVKLPIMVMNTTVDAFDQLIEHQLEPEIYSITQLEKLIDYLRKRSFKLSIHVKLDTGMHRLGFVRNEMAKLIRLVNESEVLDVKSIFTHLAAADESEHDDFTEKQLAAFKEMGNALNKEFGGGALLHVLNSAGIIRHTQSQHDMVRLGIGLYGMGVNDETQFKLRTVGTLKTIVSQIKVIPANETVGYSRKGVLERETAIATLPIGYADGYDRRFGNGVGRVWINGQYAPVVGNVCMDMIMVDVTGIALREGDEVIVFGQQNPVHAEAKKIGTISYELLTNVSERVKRVFYSE